MTIVECSYTFISAILRLQSLELTFIVLARDKDSDEPKIEDIQALPMVGDVNLFFKEALPDEEREIEVEIMIAGKIRLQIVLITNSTITEASYRRRGLAHSALSALLSYATKDPLSVPVSSFVVRIGESNSSSRALFEKLGFKLTKEANVFGEIEMRVKEFKWTDNNHVIHFPKDE